MPNLVNTMRCLLTKPALMIAFLLPILPASQEQIGTPPPLVAKCLGTSQNIISHTFATMLFSHDHTQVGVRLLCFADTTFTCCYELSIFTQNKNVVLIHQGAGIPLLCPRIRFRYFLCPTIRLWHKSVRRNRTMNPFYLGNSRSIFNIFYRMR